MTKGILRYTTLLCSLLLLLTIGGVFAEWSYALGGMEKTEDFSLGLKDFAYIPEDMPEREVNLLERLSDILNKKYQTDIVEDSLDYLLNETIKESWQSGAPYVGSMDKKYETQFLALFGELWAEREVSFILKNEDLNNDGYNEIALYSTSDPLDSTSEWPNDGVVCVYVSVFTPTLDQNRNVSGYVMVCDSLRGFCGEVRYNQNDLTPSFSTTHWLDDIGYWAWSEELKDYIEKVPDDAMSNDGTKPYRYDFNSYNFWYGWYRTAPYGRTVSQCLEGKIPDLRQQ